MRATIFRTAGLFVVAAAIVATDLHIGHSTVSPIDHVGAAVTAPADPLARELIRCRTIGMAAKDDAGCEAAWAENRQRFFTSVPSPAHSANAPPGSAEPTSDARQPK